ncbi:MAG: hypothetical protein DWQ36_01960 [Acidobacteria bacterium]|nr:MAG: hypothetical protein DWQ30_16805 [Acidobacteriota bacterium]REK11534.1 MAG: hypothetical protein DWQ36_01960 [Acidobacteriota bacterium]
MITIDRETHSDIVVGRVIGEFEVEDAMQAARRIWELTSGPRRRILWDLRQSEFSFQADEVRNLAESVRREAPPGDLRTAFLVSRDLHFGLVRMFEMMRETEVSQTGTFRDLEQALAWLRES